ncbi:uncharacterized protein G2W53_013276 [Senna tora]|uniref:Uncharacterized protein n=1 Tax=Senna tora TaxID=362788 RepID=A0A834WR61_9FABA|nr:uncharacterized protein G2W53_013276 [Senna tora]
MEGANMNMNTPKLKAFKALDK